MIQQNHYKTNISKTTQLLGVFYVFINQLDIALKGFQALVVVFALRINHFHFITRLITWRVESMKEIVK